MNILLEYFSAKVDKEDFFKPKIWNESFHVVSNDNGVRVVNFATSKILIVKSIQGSHIVTFIHLLRHLLMKRRTNKLTVF
jgi:hypothetical protein